MQRQRYEILDKPGFGIDFSYVIYHETHSKYYSFTDTSELKSVPVATFPFDVKSILCNERYLHIPKYRMPNCKEEIAPLRYKMKVSTSIMKQISLMKMKCLLSMKLANIIKNQNPTLGTKVKT